MGDVATTRWMRSRSPAAFNASWAAIMSFSTQRASPQTRLFSVRSATVRTAWKSPSEMTGKPASITSTPRASSCMATCIFCSTVIAAPGHCSPSLSVVSKICMCSFITVKMLRVRSFGNCARKTFLLWNHSFGANQDQPFTSFAPERLTGAYQDIFTDYRPRSSNRRP